jgi:nitroreductase
MDLWKTLDRRTTIRSFSERPIDGSILEKAIRAALHAPAYNHLWEWGFVLLRDPSLRERIADALDIRDVRDPARLHEMFDALPDEARRIYLRALPVQRTMLLAAPEVVVPIYRAKRGESRADGPADLNAHAAVWIGIGYLLLSLAEDGVFGCTLVPGASDEADALLGVPEGWRIATLLPIGYPRGVAVRNAHPIDVSDFLHIDRFTGFRLPTTDKPMG